MMIRGPAINLPYVSAGNPVSLIDSEDEVDSKKSKHPLLAASAGVPVSVVPVVNPDAILRLKDEMKRGLQYMCTWDYLRSKSAPNGTIASARLERIEQAEFAALIGRPTDTGLKSLVKKGAWYSINLSYVSVFGMDSIRGKGGKYQGNAQLRIDPEVGLGLKYSPSLKVLSVEGSVGQSY